jgi:hypothetical protein
MRSSLIALATIALISAWQTNASATRYWKTSVTNGNWSTVNNWSATSQSGADNAGPPLVSENVVITHSNGTAHTVTLDTNTPSLGLVYLDLTGAGTAANTLSITSNQNLTAAAISVGGNSGSVFTNGRGAVNQSNGTVTISAGTDFIMAWGTGSSGTYTLSGGNLVANQSEWIGFNGTGTFNHTGGTNTINASAVGSFYVGANNSATGTYNLSGTGALVSNETEYIGHSGFGTFNQSGGSNTITGAGNDLVLGFNPGTAGNYILSGGTLSVADDLFAGSAGSGALIVSGNASVDVGDQLWVNSAPGSGDTGYLEVSNGTVFTQGLALGTDATLRLNSANSCLRFNILSADPGAFLDYQAGKIQMGGNRTLGSDTAVNYFFGAQPNISSSKELAIEGNATLPSAVPLTMSGGTLSAQSLMISSGSHITGTQSSTINAATLVLTGSVIDVTAGNLAVGDATKVNGFYSNGTANVGPGTLTLADANDAVFDSAALVTLGQGSAPGTLAAANGLTLDFGGNIIGFGTVNTPNSIADPLTNNGHITGNSGAQPITLSGYVKGVGTFDNVNFTGTFAPGLSPTILLAGNIALASTSTLIMEVGGTTAGSGYDQIQSTGSITFDGTLQVSLINGFPPAAGQSFNLFDWVTSSGTFDTLQLPTLAGLTWNTSQLYTTGVLSVAAAGIPGDYNNNGTVDAGDYVLWRKGGPLANEVDNPGTVNGADYTAWRARFGNASVSGTGASRVNAAVPEAATIVLLIFAACGAFSSRNRAPLRVSKLIYA